MFKNKFNVLLISLALVSASLTGCKKELEEITSRAPEVVNQESDVKSEIYEFMKEWYLWNDQVPANLDVKNYQTPEELLEALTYKNFDRWSYLEDAKTFERYFKDGQFAGFGFGMKLDADQNLRVSFIYKGSPMDREGVTRGYKITKVNGKDVSDLLANKTFYNELGEDKEGVQARFTVENLAGNSKDITVAKEIINMNTVLFRNVKDVGGKKVGYLVFNTFIEKSNKELDEAFAYFQSQGISELVLDLRYNGGGSLDVAQYLSGLIGATKAGESKFVELTYNEQKKDKNKPFFLKKNAVDANLNRVFVITSKSSASASEAVINGLRPYMEVITLGDDTHGKPVGMNAVEIGKYVLVPITFKVANANGQAEYFNGIKADAKISDDLDQLFGDSEEDCLHEAMYYIQNGHFSNVNTARLKLKSVENQIELEGFRAEVGAF